MSNDKIIVGLTGGISCGKSTVSKILEENFNARIIDADKISWWLCEPGRVIWYGIVKHFGEYYLNEDKTINRKKFGSFIFSDLEAKKLLESFSHKQIVGWINKKLEDPINNNYDFIVIDAPLLIEVGLHEKTDSVVVVDIPKQLQIQRYSQRNNFSEEEAEMRINTQISREERLKYADYVIDNTLGLEELKKNVIDTFNLIKERSELK